MSPYYIWGTWYSRSNGTAIQQTLNTVTLHDPTIGKTRISLKTCCNSSACLMRQKVQKNIHGGGPGANRILWSRIKGDTNFHPAGGRGDLKSRERKKMNDTTKECQSRNVAKDYTRRGKIKGVCEIETGRNSIVKLLLLCCNLSLRVDCWYVPSEAALCLTQRWLSNADCLSSEDAPKLS